MSFNLPNPIAGIQGALSAVGSFLNNPSQGPEALFKSQLGNMLGESGMPQGQVDQISQFLNEMPNEQLGQGVNALCSAGIIPQEMSGQIEQLAQQSGVPPSSIGPESINGQMFPDQMSSILGQQFGDLNSQDEDQDGDDEAGSNGLSPDAGA